MKKIYFSAVFPRMYSATKLLIDYPPKGYVYVLPENKTKVNFLRFLLDSKTIKFFYKSVIKNIFNTSNWYSKVTSVKVPEDADLIISSHGNLEINFPWILILVDHPASLVGYDYGMFIEKKEEIQEKLLSPLCRSIIVFNEKSYNLMNEFFNKEVMKKTTLVRAAVQKQDFKKMYDKKNVLLTFIGSTGNPDDFYIKGGLEAIESFKRISPEFPNAKLVIRCKVPKEVKERYQDLENLIILDQEIDLGDWFKILRKTDIVLQPGHIYPLMASLESLSFGVPRIMLDTWGVRDYVSEENSILIKPSEHIKGYKEKEYPLNVRNKEFIEDIKKLDERVINDICNALRKLIKNPKLREKLGKNGKRIAETKFSIETRNKELKKIFDKATSK